VERSDMTKPMTRKQPASRKELLRWVLRFALFNAIAVLVILLRYVPFMGAVEGILPTFYLGVTILGHPFLISYAAFIVPLVPLVLVLPRWIVVKFTGILLGLIGLSLLLLDTVVYAQYRSHLNLAVFDLVVGGGTEIFNFSWATWAKVAMAVAGLVVLQILFSMLARKGISKSAGRRGKWIRVWLALGIVSALSVGNLIHAWADATYYRPVTALTRHLPLFYPLTAKHFLQRHGIVDMAAQRERRKLKLDASHDTSTIKYPLSELKFKANEKQFNLLFVVIDSWRFDMLTPQVAPQMHRFINQYPSWKFQRHFSGGNGTRIGIFSLFYGLYGTHWNVMAQEQIGPVFIDTLSRQGYQLGIFASAKLTTPPFDRTVFRNIDLLRSHSKGASAWERDRTALAEWSDWLDKRDSERPFFGFLFFDAPHTYSLPSDYPKVFEPMWEQVDYLALNNDFDPLPFINRYKTCIHFVDSLIGRALEGLQRRGLLENTIVVFTGDHGQEFNDNELNFWGHGGNYTRYQTQVPLAIYWPGGEAQSIDRLTSHHDIVPTLMGKALGCENPPSDYADGRDLSESDSLEWLIQGGYFNQAIREKDRITLTYATGNYEIIDLYNRPIPDANLNFNTVKSALERIARFYN
jgi:uncharacterized protein